MPLNESKGNMYSFISHTWNPIKGQCYHDCSYCYMKKWGNLKPVRFDEKELKTDLGKDNFIFVGSSCDMFAEDIPSDWVFDALDYCTKYNNKYLFQTKNPVKFHDFLEYDKIPKNSVFCATIETNRWNPDIMVNSPYPNERSFWTNKIRRSMKTYVTIEPIMDFDLIELVNMVESCLPIQVNIGADSGNNNLPEPPKEKILELITELEKFTKVNQKKNLNRLLK